MVVVMVVMVLVDGGSYDANQCMQLSWPGPLLYLLFL